MLDDAIANESKIYVGSSIDAHSTYQTLQKPTLTHFIVRTWMTRATHATLPN